MVTSCVSGELIRVLRRTLIIWEASAETDFSIKKRQNNENCDRWACLYPITNTQLTVMTVYIAMNERGQLCLGKGIEISTAFYGINLAFAILRTTVMITCRYKDFCV